VYIAITGKAFFAAAGAATALLVRNAAKTFAVNFVADVVLLFTKVFVVGINAIGAYAFLIYNPKHFQNGVFDPTIPVVFVIVETFAIASCFFSNYQLAIDTIFLSVLEDMDKNDGSAARPYFMTDKMMKVRTVILMISLLTTF
jgi:choline transporter-like protein 2/4/5